MADAFQKESVRLFHPIHKFTAFLHVWKNFAHVSLMELINPAPRHGAQKSAVIIWEMCLEFAFENPIYCVTELLAVGVKIEC